MGQYYKPVILDRKNKRTVKACMTSWSYNNGAKLMEHSYVGNDFVSAFETLIIEKPSAMVWAGDYAEKDKGLKSNVYDRCLDKLEIKPETKKTGKFKFIVNHSKNLFVDKTKCPIVSDDWKVRIHPLPLLTSEGNGKGGRDYEGTNMELVGSWARDVISIESVKPKGFKELKVAFKER